jgi:hypothetical protein
VASLLNASLSISIRVGEERAFTVLKSSSMPEV